MSKKPVKSQRQRLMDALSEARSLRQYLLTEADNMDQSAKRSKQVQAAGTLASVFGTGVGLILTGGTLLPFVHAAARIAKTGAYLATAAAMAEPAASALAKLDLENTWDKLRVEFDNPREMEDADFEISEELKSIAKDIFKELIDHALEKGAIRLENAASAATPARGRNAQTRQWMVDLCKRSTMILSVVSLCTDVYDLYQVSNDLYHENPSKAGEFLRKCAAILDKLIPTYEQMLKRA